MKTWVEVTIYIVCLSPIWGTLLWCFWEGSVRPRLIPRAQILTEVDRLWDEDEARAFERACIEEHAAWYRSEAFEQGRWKRIREEIMRRERARGTTFRKMRYLP